MCLAICLVQVTSRRVIGFIWAVAGQTRVFPVVSVIWFCALCNAVEIVWELVTNHIIAFLLTMMFDIPVFSETYRKRKKTSLGIESRINNGQQPVGFTEG
jgi:hypothetical protein